MKKVTWKVGAAALAVATLAPGAIVAPAMAAPTAAERGHGSNRAPLTTTQVAAIRQAQLTLDAAIIAALQAYLTAETGVLGNNGAPLTTAQETTLRTAARTRETAIDAAQRTYRQTVHDILTQTTSTGVSLSEAEASVANSLIRLRFSGQLDATTAGTAANYTVTVNSAAVPVGGANYNPAHSTVTLGLAAGALKAGDTVVVTWANIKDIHGTAVSGTTTITAH